MINRFACVLLCVSFFSGCASGPPPPPLTVEARDQQVAPPPADKAQIIFMQPFQPIGGWSQPTALFELKGSQKELLAIVSSKGKVVVHTEPGQHLFMSTGFGTNFLQANVEAGKRYYVLSRFIAYVGYQLRPIRKNAMTDYNATTPQFQEWLRTCREVAATPEGLNWVSTNQAAFDKAQTSAWEKYQRKSPDEHAQLTLNPEDYIAH